jgi:hypothetical protein
MPFGSIYPERQQIILRSSYSQPITQPTPDALSTERNLKAKKKRKKTRNKIRAKKV